MDSTLSQTFLSLRIYIPHWLDSMPAGEINTRQRTQIYIPHWLDSMAILIKGASTITGFTFHTG